MKPRFRYQADLFDSSEDIAQIIDAESEGHPQGPVVLATVNVRWCAPHVHHAVNLGRLMAAAPELLEIVRRFQSLCPSDEGLGGHAPMAAFFALAKDARVLMEKVRPGSGVVPE